MDVGRYVDQAIEARRASDHASERMQVERLPIFGMTKESLLAMRYRLSDGQACSHHPRRCSHTLSMLFVPGVFAFANDNLCRPGAYRSACRVRRSVAEL